MTDPLLRATRALKDKYDAAERDAERDAEARERVLDATTQGMRRRRVSRFILVPIAAAFVSLATWAAASGLTHLFSEAPPPPATTPSASSATSSATPPLALALPSALAPPPAASSAEPSVAAPAASSAAPAIALTLPAGAASVVHPTASASAKNDAEEDRLYAEAHAAHFDAHDDARALTAWDAYLAHSPSGRFAPEAKYNRALCLIRLGRRDEARVALEPFANGAFGAYRQAEAAQLVKALRGDADVP